MDEAADRRLVLPPHGFVRLVKWQGSETDIVNAARISFAKEVEGLSDADRGLIRYLLKNRHGSPFEMGFQSIWHLRVPIFVARELVRHRMHSYNEESGRYVELRNAFYFPHRDDLRTQVGKPGHYTYERLEDDEAAEQCLAVLMDYASMAYKGYIGLLERGLAKEQARMILPTNLFTEIRWTANARSLMNFLSLRSADDAMWEIRAYAKEIEKSFANHMPTCYSAWVENGRVAP